MNLIITTAAIEDLTGILDIYNDAILNTTSVYDYTPHTLEMRAKWFETKQYENIPVIVAKDDDVIAGFASYGPFRAWAAYQYSIEHSIYVHKDYRGKGIGKKLLSRLIEIAETKSIHTIIASIDASNEVSYQLHKKFGFTDVAFFKEVGFKFNRWLDLRFMQLILNNNFDPKQLEEKSDK